MKATPGGNVETARLLVAMLEQKGVRHVVLSPGSRNAPVSLLVARSPRLARHVIADERAAAFFALGIARQGGESVALACTSGTALLNYAPAVAEAYYQGVSLLVLSADRPPEWIDQDDGQTIRQRGALASLVKGSFQLPADGSAAAGRWHANRLLNEAINLSRDGHPGPVHVNIPLEEPLYGFAASPAAPERLVEPVAAAPRLREEELARLRRCLLETPRVMIVAGSCPPDGALRAALERLAARENVVVLAETLANPRPGRAIATIDRVLATLPPGEEAAHAPGLLISFGGAIISRAFKTFIREHPPREHWHVDRRTIPPDTYRALTLHVKMPPAAFLEQLAGGPSTGACPGYAARWHASRDLAAARHAAVVSRLPWCDLRAFAILLPALPAGCLLHLGNSTPVRYAQLFGDTPAARVDGNRGTSGIEGATSTAAGAAAVAPPGRATVLVTGDLGFLYDSNALWACPLSPALRVVVIVNGGGGIFRFLPGPSALPEVEELFETPHGVDIPALARLHGLALFTADDAPSLERVLPAFLAPGPRPALLAIDTRDRPSGEILKHYFESLKHDHEKLDTR
jgi:2-succinyl-5-enolpyruvyl-6-hydroxy-3-cyclohexene-1-carboxylate synthase